MLAAMPRGPLFSDRRDAGRRLAVHLAEYAGRDDIVVVALPRGGLPVGFEVSRALDVPLDVFVVRKLGFPGREELAIGALGSGGIRVMNDELLRRHPLPNDVVDAAIEREQAELEHRERVLRGDLPPLTLRTRTAIVVDDGLATGVTMLAAVRALRAAAVAELVVAVPVAPRQTCAMLAREADAVVCGQVPEPFVAVGAWYEDFTQTTDEEARALLAEARVGDG